MGQGILSITWANRWRSLSMANASAVAIERMTMACFRSASAMGLLPRGNGLDMPHGGGIPTRLGIGAIFLLPTTDDGNRRASKLQLASFHPHPEKFFSSNPQLGITSTHTQSTHERMCHTDARISTHRTAQQRTSKTPRPNDPHTKLQAPASSMCVPLTKRTADA